MDSLEEYKYYLRGKDVKTDDKLLSIESIDFHNIQMTIHKNGIIPLTKVVGIIDYLEDVLRYRMQVIEFIKRYHPDSEQYWKKIDKYESRYSIGLNLETFIDSSNKDKHSELGFYIPDNYELADRVIKEFVESGGDVSEISDNSYREYAQWECKKKTPLKKLGEFIDEKYVKPKMQKLLDDFNAESIQVENGKFEFIYKPKTQ